MTWVRLDDGFPDHPKVMALGPDRLAGMGLWLVGAGYSGRHLTDGFIPDSLLVTRLEDRLANRLVDVGLWERVAGGYRMHDYHDYQPTRAAVQAKRKMRAEVGRVGGLRSAQSRRSKDEASDQPNTQANSQPNAKQTGKQQSSSGGSNTFEPPSHPRTQSPRRSSVVTTAVPGDAVLLDDFTRPDLVALRDRGMTYIRQRELEILDGIADNERAGEWQPISTGQQVIAGWIREAPKGNHLVDFVIQRENQLKAERGADAFQAEADWQEQKTNDRTSAPERLGSIVARLTDG